MGYAQQSERAAGVSTWIAQARARLGGRLKRKSADAAELDVGGGTPERNAT